MYFVNKNIMHLIDDIFCKMSFKTENETEMVFIRIITIILIILIISAYAS
jgi:hypothetical protein